MSILACWPEEDSTGILRVLPGASTPKEIRESRRLIMRRRGWTVDARAEERGKNRVNQKGSWRS